MVMDVPVRNLLRRAVKRLVLGIYDHEEPVAELALFASQTPGSPFYGKRLIDRPAARREKLPSYPTGTPTLQSFFSL